MDEAIERAIRHVGDAGAVTVSGTRKDCMFQSRVVDGYESCGPARCKSCGYSRSTSGTAFEYRGSFQ